MNVSIPSAAEEEASESCKLVVVDLALTATSHRRFACLRRPLLAGIALGLGAVVGLVLGNAITPCLSVSAAIDPDTAEAVVSLAALDTSEGLVSMAETSRDGDAVAQWLAASNMASASASETVGGGGPDMRAAVAKAIATKDPKQARVVVKRAMRRSVARWQAKRRDLRKILKAKKHGHLKRTTREERVPAAKAAVAACVFDNLQATTQLAALAVNINDAVKTCKADQSVCAVNVANIFYSIGAVATELSFAAANCADTVTTAPNVDALCAGSISAVIQTLAEVAVSAGMIAAGCVQHDYPSGLKPSNVGSAGAPKTPAFWNTSDHVQGRRLLFGGGKAADETYCAIDAASAAWYLAQAGLRINEAANPEAGATCPPKGEKHSGLAESTAYGVSQAFCSMSVSGVIYGFLQAVYFINFAFVHCADELNTAAICGAGVDGLISSVTAVAFGGSAIHLTCDQLRQPAPVEESDGVPRRLLSEDAERGIEQLKKQFTSPAEVWKSVGFDLDEQSAELRKVQPRRLPSEELLGLVQESAPADLLGQGANKGDAMFGPKLCSS